MRPSGRGPGPQTPEQRARRVFALLVLACLSVITLDAKAGDGSPLDPVRSAVGNVVGPMESATATAVRPFTVLNDAFRTNHGLREDVAWPTTPADRQALLALIAERLSTLSPGP